jgi:hypothetical protein
MWQKCVGTPEWLAEARVIEIPDMWSCEAQKNLFSPFMIIEKLKREKVMSADISGTVSHEGRN